MKNSQIKSKKRVAEHGEVFTSLREVNAMLDLVKDECNRINSKFLEPACGNGNFLFQILKRKLKIVDKKFKKYQFDWEKNAMCAIMSCYGIELLTDNAEECRCRLFTFLKKRYQKLFKLSIDLNFLESVKYVISKNIVNGDTLNMIQTNGEPIVFSEWNFILNDKVKRKEFAFVQLITNNLMNEQINNIILGNINTPEDVIQYIPRAIAEYPLVNFKQLAISYM